MKKSKVKNIVLFIVIIIVIVIITFVILMFKDGKININQKKSDAVITIETNGGIADIEANTIVNVDDTSESGFSKLEYVWDMQNEKEPSSGWTEFKNGEEIKKSDTGMFYLWIRSQDNNGTITVTKSNIFEIGDVEKIATKIQTENKRYDGLTTDFSYNNPVIPVGFVAVNTKVASWDKLETDFDKGLVIQDEKGNQFVWVPIDGKNLKYVKNLNYPHWCDTPTNATVSDSLPTGVNKEVDQINKYKGFYIARYESGKLDDKLVIKKNMSVWNNITHNDARSKSEEMYKTENIKSGLITGTMWDTTMKWIEASGINVATDSREWGNYASSKEPTSIIQKTGYSNNWRVKNIYDLSGNTFEWTNEKNMNDFIYRGGAYSTSGLDNPAAFRHSYIGATVANSDISFRVVLYIL